MLSGVFTGHQIERRAALRNVGIVLALLTALAFVFATGPAPAAAQDSVEVSAVDNAFEPVSVEVSAGGTVTWTNNGAIPHTVTGENFAHDVILNPGESTSFTFSDAGTYTYVCQFHPGMAGTVVVAGVPAEPEDPAAPADPAPAAPAPPHVGSGTTFGQPGNGMPLLLAGLAVLFGIAALRLREPMMSGRR